MLGGVPPLLHVHHRGILHAVGQHLPPTKRVAPSGGVTFSSRSGSRLFSRFPGPGATRHSGPERRCPGSRRPQVRPRGGDGPGGHAGSVRSGRLPVGLPRAPSLPRRRRRRRCSPPRPPALSGVRRPVGPAGTGGAEEGRGCVPPAKGLGGGPGARCQRAGEGLTAPLRRARAPGGSALAEAVGAGGGGRAGRAGKGREGRGERGEELGEGLQARGRGSGRRGGGCSPAREARARRRAPTPPRAQPAAWHRTGLLLPAQKLEVASEGGGAGGSEPSAPPSWLSVVERICAFLSPPLRPLPSHIPRPL